ncbi:MAG: hypothetical protein RLZZ301_1768 [Bacteroidota bacterium]
MHLNSWAQESCVFNYYNKKGGHFLFSTYYETDLHTPREGVCQTLINGKIYERRVFANGRLTEEIANTLDGKPRVRATFSFWDADSILVVLDTWYENGDLQEHSIFYTDASGRRCMKQCNYGLAAKKRSECSYAFIRYNELSESDKSMHPPHTIDEDGYTYLMVPIGKETQYDLDGKVHHVQFHRFVSDGSYEHRSLQGPYIEYYPSGKVRAKGVYQEGQLTGVYQTFFESGRMQSEGFYDHDVSVGTWKSWHLNGELASLYVYDLESAHPFTPSKKEWAENGQLTLDQQLDVSGTGTLYEWTSSGVKIHEVDIVMLDRTAGTERYWFENGQLQYTHNFRKDADTCFIEYYKNGQLKRLDTRQENRSESTQEWRNWSESGTLERYQLKQSRIDGYFQQLVQDYYPTGQLKRYDLFKNTEHLTENYSPNGTKIYFRRSINDSLEGNYQLLDTMGQVLLQYQYQKGLRNGWCREYTPDGKPLFAAYYVNGKRITDSIQVARVSTVKLSREEQDGLWNLISSQVLDTHLVSKKQIFDDVKTVYAYFPAVFGELPKQALTNELGFTYLTRIFVKQENGFDFVYVNNNQLSSCVFLIYPDGEVELWNRSVPLNDLQQQYRTDFPKNYLWND